MALEREFSEAFEACPVCGGELAEKRVEKLLRGGDDTARMEVGAMVCLSCGERLYPEGTVREFERVRTLLQRGEVADLRQVGRAYEVG